MARNLTRVGAEERSLEEQINDPNCDIEVWWGIARANPIEAQASILYPILTLEDPARWITMEEEQARYWMRDALRRLSAPLLRLFAADCAAHVLSIWEKQGYDDPRPRQAIAVSRAHARNQAADYDLQVAHTAVSRAVHDSPYVSFRDNAFLAAYHAGEAAEAAARVTAVMLYVASDAARAAQKAVYEESKKHTQDSKKFGEAETAELTWQWRRIVEYLRGDA